MKQTLLSLIVCPDCLGPLEWVAFGSERDGMDTDGLLSCREGHQFPVIQGIPRFLKGAAFAALRQRYPEYFRRAAAQRWSAGSQLPVADVLLRTIDRFGFEWTEYADYSADNFARFLEPVRSLVTPGMTALDAGCGAGRHLLKMAGIGVNVVGVDVSWAVESAWQRTRREPHVHVLQADLCRLPFRDSTFDFIYSLGVLHHLADPAQGLSSLTRVLRPAGIFLAWVYMQTTRKVLVEPLRRLVASLSPRSIGAVSWLLAAAEYGFVIGPYALVRRLGKNGQTHRFVPRRIQEYADLGFRVSRVDWYDRLAAPVSKPMTHDQAQAFIALAELCEQEIQAVDDSWWACIARRRSTARAAL
jgi:SAM-dependent methyltransferase